MRVGRLVNVVIAVVVVGGLSVVGMRACIVPAPVEQGERSGPTAQNAAVKLGANLGDKLNLLGAQLMPAHVSAAQPMTVQLVFQVLAPLSDDYNLFVHVEDAATGAQLANVDHPPTSGPTSSWRMGEGRRDEFQVRLPEGTNPRAVNLWVGLWNPKTDERLPLKNPGQVRSDGNNRILVGPIPAGNE